MAHVEAGLAELMFGGVGGTAPSPGVHQTGELVKALPVESKHLSHFAGCRAAPVGNDVCGHGGAELAISLVNVLNRLFSLIAAAKVEIDVGPFAALFREKSFEKQLHANGINSCNPQRIANRAVGGRAAPLHENVFLSAEANNVPNNQEIAGQV